MGMRIIIEGDTGEEIVAVEDYKWRGSLDNETEMRVVAREIFNLFKEREGFIVENKAPFTEKKIIQRQYLEF